MNLSKPAQVFTSDYFTVKIPEAYSFATSPTVVDGLVERYPYHRASSTPHGPEGLEGLPVLNVVGAVSGIPDTFGVTRIDGDIVTVTRCAHESAGPDVNVSFALGPFLNRGYASLNYFGEGAAPGVFGVLHKDRSEEVIEGSNLTNAPPLVPQRLTDVNVTAGHVRDGDVTDLAVSFRSANPLPAGGEVHLYLPDNFELRESPPSTFSLRVGNISRDVDAGLTGSRRENVSAADPGGRRAGHRVVVRLTVPDLVPGGSFFSIIIAGVRSQSASSASSSLLINTATAACKLAAVPAAECTALVDSNYGDVGRSAPPASPNVIPAPSVADASGLLSVFTTPRERWMARGRR